MDSLLGRIYSLTFKVGYVPYCILANLIYLGKTGIQKHLTSYFTTLLLTLNYGIRTTYRMARNTWLLLYGSKTSALTHQARILNINKIGPSLEQKTPAVYVYHTQ